MKLLEKEMQTDLGKVETIVSQLSEQLKPVSQMNDTVGLSKKNISESL
jgi:hypothetical protein